ncbi:MAG: restriction endonuclease subunit S [Muribaculaceae bacterium]|nr:restriction endonuclease subunit S [Muribaculaceae bacterium]
MNNSINNNLEQQAQAIFKSWFVDFEPFGGVMPKDWKQSNLLEIADYLNGLAMQKFRPKDNEIGLPVLKIKELRQGMCDLNSELCSPSIKEDYIVQNGDVIFSWSGSLLVDFWCGGVCGLNQHLFKVTSNQYDKWFYYSWTKYHLNKFASIAADMATTMGHIKREELSKSDVLIPNREHYHKINDLLKPIYNLIISNRIENYHLSTIRDTLLPKLMNGEIDVSNVKI